MREIWEWEKFWKQAVSMLEHKANMSNTTEGINVTLLTGSCGRRELTELTTFLTTGTSARVAPLSKLKQQVGIYFKLSKKYQTRTAFPFLIKAKGINWLLDGAPIFLLFSPQKWSWMVQTQLWLR